MLYVKLSNIHFWRGSISIALKLGKCIHNNVIMSLFHPRGVQSQRLLDTLMGFKLRQVDGFSQNQINYSLPVECVHSFGNNYNKRTVTHWMTHHSTTVAIANANASVVEARPSINLKCREYTRVQCACMYRLYFSSWTATCSSRRQTRSRTTLNPSIHPDVFPRPLVFSSSIPPS